MQAKIIFVTLGVDDLERSVAFYRDGLGWQTEGIVARELHDEITGADGTIALFVLETGLLLALYERLNLAKDADVGDRLEPQLVASEQAKLSTQQGRRAARCAAAMLELLLDAFEPHIRLRAAHR